MIKPCTVPPQLTWVVTLPCSVRPCCEHSLVTQGRAWKLRSCSNLTLGHRPVLLPSFVLSCRRQLITQRPKKVSTKVPFFTAAYYSIVHEYHVFFIHSFADRYIDCFVGKYMRLVIITLREINQTQNLNIARFLLLEKPQYK